MDIIEAKGGNTLEVDPVSPGDRFFITRHGVREPLVDPTTDEQYFFTVEGNGRDEFTVPHDAAPSMTKCRDRYVSNSFRAVVASDI